MVGLVSVYSENPTLGITCTNDTIRVLCTAPSDILAFSNDSYINYEIPDEIAPQITINGQNYVGTQTGSQYVEAGSVFTESATWIDNRAGSGTVIGTGDIVDTTMTGSYISTYTVTDTADNTTELTMTYIVRDTTAPDITLNGPDPVIHELDYGPYYDE